MRDARSVHGIYLGNDIHMLSINLISSLVNVLIKNAVFCIRD